MTDLPLRLTYLLIQKVTLRHNSRPTSILSVTSRSPNLPPAVQARDPGHIPLLLYSSFRDMLGASVSLWATTGFTDRG